MPSAPATAQIRVDATNLNAYLRELQAMSPAREFGQILDHEVAAATTAAIRNTRVAKAGAIRATINSRDWMTYQGKKYYLEHRYPTPLWRQLKAATRKSLQDKLARRGLSKRSWLSAYPALGQPTPAAIPAFVRNANARGRQFANTTIARSGTAAKATLALINRGPTAIPAGGRRAIIRAINGRASYFRRNMATGFSHTAARRAAKYPGIFVR